MSSYGNWASGKGISYRDMYFDSLDVSKHIMNPLVIHPYVSSVFERMSTLFLSRPLPKDRSDLEIMDEVQVSHDLPSRIETCRRLQPTQTFTGAVTTSFSSIFDEFQGYLLMSIDFMKISRFPRICIDSHGNLLIPIDVHEYEWKSIDFHGLLGISMNFP